MKSDQPPFSVTEQMLTIWPEPLRFIEGTTAWASATAAVALTAWTRSYSSSG